jgi:hypothetical protein
MSELSSRGSRKRKGASQVRITSLERPLPKFDARTKHPSLSNFQHQLKQRTLFDHFLVTRKPTPVPTIPQRDDPRDEEPASQRASDIPELSSVEDVNDIAHVGLVPGVFSTRSDADVDIGALAIYPPFLP